MIWNRQATGDWRKEDGSLVVRGGTWPNAETGPGAAYRVGRTWISRRKVDIYKLMEMYQQRSRGWNLSVVLVAQSMAQDTILLVTTIPWNTPAPSFKPAPASSLFPASS